MAAALIFGDPQPGSASEATGPQPGTFLAPSVGLSGMMPWPPCPAFHRRSFWLEQASAKRALAVPPAAKQRRVRQSGDVISVLARTAREVEAAAVRGRVTPAVRTKFQAVALLLRDERARVRAVPGNASHRGEQLKRLDGIAAILATTAVRDAGLLALLAEDTSVSDAARSLKRQMEQDLGIESAPEEIAQAPSATAPAEPESRVVPQTVISRQLANPFLAPDFSAAPQRTSRPRRLADWELLGPLLQFLRARRRGSPGVHGAPGADGKVHPGGPGTDAASGAGGRRGRGRPPDVPAGR